MKKRFLTILTIAIAGIITITMSTTGCKKDSYGYTCKCVDATKLRVDTFITYRVETSGEAFFLCTSFQDTANKYGRPYECEITK